MTSSRLPVSQPKKNRRPIFSEDMLDVHRMEPAYKDLDENCIHERAKVIYVQQNFNISQKDLQCETKGCGVFFSGCLTLHLRISDSEKNQLCEWLAVLPQDATTPGSNPDRMRNVRWNSMIAVLRILEERGLPVTKIYDDETTVASGAQVRPLILASLPTGSRLRATAPFYGLVTCIPDDGPLRYVGQQIADLIAELLAITSTTIGRVQWDKNENKPVAKGETRESIPSGYYKSDFLQYDEACLYVDQRNEDSKEQSAKLKEYPLAGPSNIVKDTSDDAITKIIEYFRECVEVMNRGRKYPLLPGILPWQNLCFDDDFTITSIGGFHRCGTVPRHEVLLAFDLHPPLDLMPERTKDIAAQHGIAMTKRLSQKLRKYVCERLRDKALGLDSAADFIESQYAEVLKWIPDPWVTRHVNIDKALGGLLESLVESKEKPDVFKFGPEPALDLTKVEQEPYTHNPKVERDGSGEDVGKLRKHLVTMEIESRPEGLVRE